MGGIPVWLIAVAISAAVSFVLALVSIFCTLVLCGGLIQRLNAAAITISELQGHRLRLDANVAALAKTSRVPAGVLAFAKEPSRPQ